MMSSMATPPLVWEGVLHLQLDDVVDGDAAAGLAAGVAAEQGVAVFGVGLAGHGLVRN